MVAIPVRDDLERITGRLLALGAQDGPVPGVVRPVNNTTGATVAHLAGLVPMLRCPLQVVEHVFQLARANAGHACRLDRVWRR